MEGLISVTEELNKIEVKRQRELASLSPDPSLSAHDYLRQVYQDPRQPVHIRMKAAIEAIAYERPRLAVTANIAGQDIATLLEERIRRITQRQREEGEEADDPR
jgi:hypothetical protein